MNQPVRWRMGAVAAAMAVLGSIATLPAHALGLGRVIVQSALGEPLRAEIEIVEISADEAASLRTSVANADAFKAAGLEYTAAVANVQISLQRRADGRAFLRLSSDRPVSEPFVDLILEARWASGRIVRDYTMLFDPPNLRQAAAPAMQAPTAPLISRPAPPPPVASMPAPPRPSVAPAQPAPPSPTPSRPAPVAKAPAPQPAPAERTASADSQKIVVKAGDTAGKIAAQAKPASVSLDQMLVALLRSNPDAFIGGNVNRLKSGAVLEVPTGDQAEYIPAAEASRTIVAQSKDFNEFRRKLAEGAPTTQVAGADRKAAGQVQAKVEDKAPAAATPDKLTLSKGAVQSKAAAEEKIAQDRQAKEAAARVAELSKNISDLNKLTSSPAAPAAPATPATPPMAPAATSPTVPGVVVATPAAASAAPGALPAAAPAASAPVAMPAASPANEAAAPAASASAAAPVPAAAVPAASAPAPVKKPVVIPPPPPEPSLIDELLDNPLMLAGAAALLVLLAAFGVYRSRQRKNAAAVDSSFLESRLQPDSFFGASGGQRIDTNEANVTGSSMVYSPSQLDAAGDVDPVAEADVYLAYGRDLQAEEILKEAIRVSPTRVAIHAKLMEIYAKRRDTRAFEMVATEAYNLTRGQGVEWAHMAEMGRELDPANPMYQPGGQPVSPAASSMAVAGASVAALAAGQTLAQAARPAPEPAAAAVDFDLDLDFSLGDEPDAPVAVAPPAPVAPAPAAPVQPVLSMPAAAAAPTDNSLDFSSATLVMPAAAPAPAKPADPPPAADNSLNFATEPAALNTGAGSLNTGAGNLDTSGGMLEFDMGALSLDLDGPATESPKTTAASALAPTVESDDPLETKFALAEEFRAIGDVDGARSLAEEVVAQSSGSLKSKAQAFLNALA
ncbi:MAG: fimbrial protein FimV [Polaromonas sp.]|uniref:FimV/HubP family polar landmark protein n=1 Tax=Polaromonas sp. TaxID=1869339 RepID=UPI0024897A69|nr:FimV/HubP family polar landmark protein [Polaromonas sp.]MDI1237665.1 fimbrial protein FimV [Polaromonas sp.]